MTSPDTPLNPADDLRLPGEMTLIEHLKELRNRVIVSALAVVIGVVVCFFFWETIFGWILAPAREHDPSFAVVSFSPLDRISVIFKIGMYGGLIIASPVVIYEILAFITPGLTAKEKKILFPGLIGVVTFLLLGMAFAYWVILPRSLSFLLGLGGEDIEDAQNIKLYTDFVIRIVFWVGICFELPVVLGILARLGMIRAGQLLSFWRYAIVIVFVVAAVVTPTPDPLTQGLVAGPLFILYFVGILFAWILQRPQPVPAPGG